LIKETAGSGDGVDEVVNLFAREGFLIRGRDGIVDVIHESLITRWARLKTWVDHEQLSAKWYLHLANAAKERLSPWRGRELKEALEYQRVDGWNEAWALQYGPGYNEAMRFLKRSARLRILRVLFAVSIIAVIIAGTTLFIYRLNQEKGRAEREAVRAEQQAKRAEAAELEAKSARDEAKSEARRAQAAIASNDAERQRLLKEADIYRRSASDFRSKVAVATGKTPPAPPIVKPKPVPDGAPQRFLLGAYSLQPVKGLEGRAAVFIGELPTRQRPGLVFVALSRVVGVRVPEFNAAAADKSLVRDLIERAKGRRNARFPPLSFVSFPVSRDAHPGSGLELGGFSVSNNGAKYTVILKEYQRDGGSEKLSLELEQN
jgi:hypothetical protein